MNTSRMELKILMMIALFQKKDPSDSTTKASRAAGSRKRIKPLAPAPHIVTYKDLATPNAPLLPPVESMKGYNVM